MSDTQIVHYNINMEQIIHGTCCILEPLVSKKGIIGIHMHFCLLTGNKLAKQFKSYSLILAC